ncbi:hypothetical protein CVT25_003625, partial [Psilocybe cyanescens]
AAVQSLNPNQNDRERLYEEFPNAQAEPNRAEGVPDGPKIWNIEDSLKYNPPDGDPWEILFDTLMKRDKMRCDAWKDEVCLFSAVVTALIVESYRPLQSDPNDIIINLLSHIATRIDGPLDSNPIVIPPVMQTLSPNASSVRVNASWFVSLVLSLITVLVGIIALQWLREHQSCSRSHLPGKYALGVIDFLNAIGNWAVVIPVTVVVCLLYSNFSFYQDCYAGSAESLRRLPISSNTLHGGLWSALSIRNMEAFSAFMDVDAKSSNPDH